MENQSISLHDCWKLITEDAACFKSDKTGKCTSLLITCTFRIGTYLKSKKNIIATIVLFPIRIIYFFFKLFTGIQLPLGTSVGG